MSTLTQDIAAPDLDELTFDAEVDAADYARIMRRVGRDGDEAGTRVSAFNSSI